jgi:chromosome partitioning protein
LHPPVLGEVKISAAGVPTGLRPLGFAVSKQKQPMLSRNWSDTHSGDSAPRPLVVVGACQDERVTRILAVANQKGGVAKTTTVASLGAAMVEKGRRVLLVDLDPQGCLTFSLGQDPDKLPVSIHEVLLGDVEPDAALVDTSEGMTLLPANIDLAGAEAMLLMRAGREYALKRALAKINELFDVVIIDCPPSLGVLTLNGLTAADDVIVPLQCETLAHRGVGQFLRTITDVQQITNGDLTLLGALPTLYDSRTTHSRDVLLDVADRYDMAVLAPPIPRTVRFAEATASGASVLAGHKNKGAIAYRELANALLTHWKTGQTLATYTPDL